ncbi:MAG: alpha/beta fold hydrolase [Myxococcales bacterium]|nr:alpha/beta fold hydrolase [Myxococcales bacterium]
MPSEDTPPARFDFDGGSTGILLLHGYTGCPSAVRPMGEYLASRGMRVAAPLLPGHGTGTADLNTRTWREVADAAAEELYALQGQCDRVFVGGLSMGGLLSLHLGQRCSGIAGIIPMAAAIYAKSPLRFLLPFIRHVVTTFPKSNDPQLSVEDPTCAEFLWSYDREALHFAAQLLRLMKEVRANFSKVHQPLLIFQGAHDRTVPMKAAHAIADESSSQDVELVVLPHSGHCLSVDGEREQVFSKSWQWIQRLS